MIMAFNRVHLLPVLVFILIPSSFLLTYTIAIYLKHVEVDFPYISDTGAKPPESCIFSLCVNLIAAMLAFTMYFRYKLVEQHYRDNLSSESTTVLRLNFVAIVIGFIGCFGVSILANFQEILVIQVHMAGALVAFVAAFLYSWLHTAISRYLCPLLISPVIVRIRCILTSIISISLLSTLVAGILAHHKFHGADITKWHPNDGGFQEHVISTASEWILVMAFDFFILTFAEEMKKIAIGSPQVHFIIEDQELRVNDMYNNDDHISITQSQSSVKANSLQTSPYAEYGENNLTTHAVIH